MWLLVFPCLFHPPPFPPIFPIHSLMLSVHVTLGLPLSLSPSTIPSNISHPLLDVVCPCGSWSSRLFHPPPFPPIFPIHSLMWSVHVVLSLPLPLSPLFHPPPFPPIFPIHSLMLSVHVALGLPVSFTLHHSLQYFPSTP